MFRKMKLTFLEEKLLCGALVFFFFFMMVLVGYVCTASCCLVVITCIYLQYMVCNHFWSIGYGRNWWVCWL